MRAREWRALLEAEVAAIDHEVERSRLEHAAKVESLVAMKNRLGAILLKDADEPDGDDETT